MYFYIIGDNTIYSTTNNGNGKLKINGSNKINEIYEEFGKSYLYLQKSLNSLFKPRRQNLIWFPVKLPLEVHDKTELCDLNHLIE